MNPNPNESELRRTVSPGQNRQQFTLSADEMRVLKECNKESFFKRCLPLSAFLASSTYLGVKNGFLKPNVKYGATPKVIVSVVLGYFVGKFSYQSKCAERLMQLPNSQLGEILRQRRRGNVRDNTDSAFGAGMSLTPFGNLSSNDMYSDFNPNNSLDIDTTRPENPGLDDYYRPSMDNPIYEEEEMPPFHKHSTAYEELRKKNREEYQQKRMGNFKDLSKPITPPQISNENYSTDNNSGRDDTPQLPKNKYGDVWG